MFADKPSLVNDMLLGQGCLEKHVSCHRHSFGEYLGRRRKLLIFFVFQNNKGIIQLNIGYWQLFLLPAFLGCYFMKWFHVLNCLMWSENCSNFINHHTHYCYQWCWHNYSTLFISADASSCAVMGLFCWKFSSRTERGFFGAVKPMLSHSHMFEGIRATW